MAEVGFTNSGDCWSQADKPEMIWQSSKDCGGLAKTWPSTAAQIHTFK